MRIDVNFDFRSDANGEDPDTNSPLLKSYHQYLWSKKLPSGNLFLLKNGRASEYLVFENVSNRIVLSSDSIGNSYGSRKKPPPVLKLIQREKIESFKQLISTIGGFILFPGKKIDGLLTINQERGVNPLIADRFDLTLECIRLFYLSEESPLSKVLIRYWNFFQLFEDFKGYVDFFLLNDLVNSQYSKINYFNAFSEVFIKSPIPASVDEYLIYRENSMLFTQKRNQRIIESISS